MRDLNPSLYESSWTQNIEFRHHKRSHRLCGVANILLDHNIEELVFVKVAKGGLTELISKHTGEDLFDSTSLVIITVYGGLY